MFLNVVTDEDLLCILEQGWVFLGRGNRGELISSEMIIGALKDMRNLGGERV